MAFDQMADFERALVIVAHPDDAEFGAAGTVALWVDRGVEVDYVICTDGAAGAAEQRQAADILGVKDVVFLGHPDGGLRASDELRRELVRLIRRYRPDRVICQNAVRNYASLYGNHPDHLAAGRAAIEAIYPYARNPLAFRELLAEGLEPHSVREVLVSGTDSPDYFVDVATTLERKFEALACHRSQHPAGQDPRPRVLTRMAQAGEAQGIAYAESFRRLSSQ
jgi:LmbE family N-acetylglucosaminyl deacetylase